jgi:2-polyprenyl-6-hydroxyphenyl methylase/3-demethylubiquinone-9 3-methyltransferase
MNTYAEEIAAGERFSFGANWERFQRALSEDRIFSAEASLRAMLEVESLEGKSFLDVGSGSGIISLAARRMGATVRSFDYDLQSVNCARELKRRNFHGDPSWIIEQGSVLDSAFLARLGQFDIVYAWGVLHHTGNLWQALENVSPLVARGGHLFIAIYNDQGWLSQYWRAIKVAYNKSPWLRGYVIALHWPYLVGLRWIVRRLTCRPLERGMTLTHDMADWLGGLPFEVARVDALVEFYRKRGLIPVRIKIVGRRHGCNELVFVRP